MRKLGLHKVMWGSDYPHNEGTSPFSRESLRRAFHDWSPEDLRQVLAGTAADVYGFDLDELAPIARRGRPDGRGGRDAARRRSRRAPSAPRSTADPPRTRPRRPTVRPGRTAAG